MGKKLFALSTICFLIVLSSNGHATEDIYVDLSVLDTVPQDSIGFIQAEPLFPEVKKTSASTKKKSSGTNKVKRPLPQPSKPLPPVIEEKTEIEQENIKEMEQPSEEFEIHIYPKEEFENTKNPFAQAAKEMSEQSPENMPEVNIENKEIPNATGGQITEDIANVKQENPLDAENEEVNLQENENESETENVKQESEIVPTVETEKTLLSAQVQDNSEELKQAILPKEVYTVSFVEESTELSETEKQRLESIIQNFDQTHKSKISIKAYLYDDGQNSFLKKRISLNRATEVRSYLLSHGFKNFSIKIVNTTSDNEYKNTVEIEEIK